MTSEELLDRVAPPVPFEESGYRCDDGEYFSARSLDEQAKKEDAETYVFPLEHFDFSVCVWHQNGRVADYAYHMRRAMETDLSVPIIVGPLGGVLDGFHRILKATITKQPLLAKRLKKLPPATVHNDPDKEDQ